MGRALVGPERAVFECAGGRAKSFFLLIFDALVARVPAQQPAAQIDVLGFALIKGVPFSGVVEHRAVPMAAFEDDPIQRRFTAGTGWPCEQSVSVQEFVRVPGGNSRNELLAQTRTEERRASTIEVARLR